MKNSLPFILPQLNLPIVEPELFIPSDTLDVVNRGEGAVRSNIEHHSLVDLDGRCTDLCLHLSRVAAVTRLPFLVISSAVAITKDSGPFLSMPARFRRLSGTASIRFRRERVKPRRVCSSPKANLGVDHQAVRAG